MTANHMFAVRPNTRRVYCVIDSNFPFTDHRPLLAPTPTEGLGGLRRASVIREKGSEEKWEREQEKRGEGKSKNRKLQNGY